MAFVGDQGSVQLIPRADFLTSWPARSTPGTCSPGPQKSICRLGLGKSLLMAPSLSDRMIPMVIDFAAIDLMILPSCLSTSLEDLVAIGSPNRYIIGFINANTNHIPRMLNRSTSRYCCCCTGRNPVPGSTTAGMPVRFFVPPTTAAGCGPYIRSARATSAEVIGQWVIWPIASAVARALYPPSAAWARRASSAILFCETVNSARLASTVATWDGSPVAYMPTLSLCVGSPASHV